MTDFRWDSKEVLVTGGGGFLGSYVVDKLIARGVTRSHIRIPRSHERDLRIWENCVEIMKGIDVVIHLAANVGGIGYNEKYPGTLFFDNIIMGTQLIEAARRENIEKFVAVGTVCAYPKYAPVPFKENDLWNGYPEETNGPYGIAKKALLVQAQAYRTQYDFNTIYLLPVNLYGPRDNFRAESSHVIPALIGKMVDARIKGSREVVVWGTGEASREFLYVNDAAEAILLASERYNEADPVNVGAGFEIKIKDLAGLIAKLTRFDGTIAWDRDRPDGQPRRMLDTSLAYSKFGFKANTSLEDGLRQTIDWYETQRVNLETH